MQKKWYKKFPEDYAAGELVAPLPSTPAPPVRRAERGEIRAQRSPKPPERCAIGYARVEPRAVLRSRMLAAEGAVCKVDF
jgi:hypothetical protein